MEIEDFAIDVGKQPEGLARKLFEAIKGVLTPKPSEAERAVEEVEKERAVAVGMVWDRIWSALDDISYDDGYPYLMDVYVEEREGGSDFFALVAMDGKLFRWPISVEDDEVRFGELQQVKETFTEVEGRTLSVTRQANGRVRVAQIVNTAVINRVGEIDSTLMFDKFIEHAEETDAWPLVDVMHMNVVTVGRVVPGGLIRDDWCYIAIWEFDDTELGRAAEEGFMSDQEFWGSSIQFQPLEREFIEADGMRIPVYVDGVNTFITLTPETRAAAWFTGEKVSRSRPMTNEQYETLVKLIGEEQAAPFRDTIRETNADINADGRIARQQGEEVDTEVVDEVEAEEVEEEAQEDADPGSEVDTVEEEVEEDRTVTQVMEFDVEDEDVVRAVAEAAVSYPAFSESVSSLVREMVDPLLQARDDRIAGLVAEVDSLKTELETRIGELERDDDKKKVEWLSELPARRVFVKGQTHRAREVRNEDDGEEDIPSFATVSESTLEKWAD